MGAGRPFLPKLHSENITLDDEGGDVHQRELNIGHVDHPAININRRHVKALLIIEASLPDGSAKAMIMVPDPHAGSWAHMKPLPFSFCVIVCPIIW